MFSMPKRKKIYPAYVSKHNSNCDKQVILLMILNRENYGIFFQYKSYQYYFKR